MTTPVPLSTQFEAVRAQLLARDEQRLARQLAQARRGGKFDDARFAQDLQKAQLAAENRLRLRPETISYPAELPVVQAKDALCEAIAGHQVVVVCGETGSGKTTQLPKLCLELGRGTRGLIGHTQPRRLAARSVANRIARELNGNIGDLVGYETRFDRRVSERSLIKLMTDGILLAELQRDRELLAYDTIIIDEAHERSLNIDFLLGWLKRLLPRRPDLKVIITSATLDPEKLAQHFADARGQAAPIFTVEGRAYPVEIRYREADKDDDLEAQVASAIDSLWSGNRVGDTLVFLPGEREINDLTRSLPGRFPRAEVLPLYSRLPAEKQDKVFSSGGAPRIVLATNVAETSVTVPGIRYVVDTGTARINRYSPRLGVQQLQIEGISQAASNQRSGRCGRVGPGIALRLYEQDNFDTRPLFTDPEILRANLAGVILQMATLGLGDVEDFPWLDAPEQRHVSEGYRLLQTLGALDDDKRITPLGRELGRLPLDPRIARIALSGRGTAYREHVWVLAAALSVQDPHEVPPDQQNAARLKHAEWRHPKSDFFTLLNLWQRYDQWSSNASNRQLRKLCKENFVSYLRMEEWEAVYKQIIDMLGRDDAAKPKTEQALDKLYSEIHKCLLAGLIDHIGQKAPEKPDYTGPRGRRFKVFPGSTLAKKPPLWIMSAQLAQTSQLFARVNAVIEPEWLADVAPHLVRRVLQDPIWHAERGEVTAMESVSLFGMQVLKRARHYGRDEPAKAREIFIREALVRGDMPNKPAFLEKNLALLDDVRDKEARLRRPDLLADENQFYNFYDVLVPADVCTTVGLKNWLRREPAAQRQLTMAEADALKPGANADIATLFPDHLDLAGTRVELSYSHDPGDEADGVTFEIPVAQLFALPAARFDWLVPGLLPAKIEALIRGLPMQLRRLCTPAAEYATAIVHSANPDDGELLNAVCARFQAMIGVTLKPEDFSPAKLEAHLRPRLVLIGADGKALGQGESLAALQKQFGGAARNELSRRAATSAEAKRWTRETVLDWDFGAMPEAIEVGGARAYPALTAADDRIGLKLFESAEAARAAHAAGAQALLLARVADRLKDLARTARSRLGISLAQTGLSAEALAQQVAERAARAYWNPAEIRDEAAFRKALERRGEFGREAAKRLDDVCAWLVAGMELRKKLDAIAKPWPDANSDLRAQLQTLFAPGFILAIPEESWPRITVYLKAATIRAERLPHKPQRDLEMQKQVRAVAQHLKGPFHPARWLIEEWRVALFAQELRANGSPTAGKIQAALAA
ncbi:MAG: ATP-dependent RNA helicase HrpA [Nevskia sp.]|nr:ATP-dependent RNA helicase HrpA [Nevskia sp.]MCK9386190.1 ATP-dependent RNA helicase HrpA [Nevskia sp.]